MHFQRWSSIEDLAGPQLRTKFGVIEVKLPNCFCMYPIQVSTYSVVLSS